MGSIVGVRFEIRSLWSMTYHRWETDKSWLRYNPFPRKAREIPPHKKSNLEDECNEIHDNLGPVTWIGENCSRTVSGWWRRRAGRRQAPWPLAQRGLQRRVL